MKAACTLLALGAALAGLLTGWVSACEHGYQRQGETTVEHLGVRS